MGCHLGGREDLRGQVCAGTWVLFVDGQDRLLQKRLRNWRVCFMGENHADGVECLGGGGMRLVRQMGWRLDLVRDSWHYSIMHVG